MFLKALEIQGFKSFPDRTKISFEGGVTAVVGPNGSGKSNISDAIRWVLGETSSKQLRGAGKMEDVIFGGARKRSPMGFAAVSLYIDNTAHRLDVEKDEVVVTRRYYRSGESEYAINGQNVRLRDIYELFLDTGIGRDGYSIIGQGRIAEIVGAKSSERREIFEEASGIARYRYRKNEAERRLAAAEENLLRLRDILGELTGRVGPLEQESEKAKTFLQLSEKKKTLEVTLWADTLRTARDKVRAAQRDRDAAQGDYDRAGEEERGLEAQTEGARRQIEQLIVEIERQNGEIRAISERAAGADSSIAVLENDLAHMAEREAELQREIEAAGAGDAAAAEELDRRRQQVREAQAAIGRCEEKIGELGGRLGQMAAEEAAAGQQRGQLTGALAELTQQATGLKVRAAAAETAAETAAAWLKGLKEEIEEGQAHADRLAAEAGENKAYLDSCADQLTRLGNIAEGLRLKLAGRQEAVDGAQGALQQLQSQREAAAARLRVLQDLEKSMDGYQQSTRHVMQAAAARRLRGVVGPVSAVLQVKPGYELAVETALGFAAQNLVVQDEKAAKAAIALLKADRAGRATFLPLDTLQPARMTAPLPQGVRLAVELVETGPEYARVAQNLLGRILVAQDLDEAGRVARALGYRYRVVTLDGQQVNAGGSFTGGSAARSVGLFTRRAELQKLQEKLQQLAGEEETRRAALEKLTAEQEKLAAQLSAAESEALTASEDQIRAGAEQQRLQAELEQAGALLAQRRQEAARQEDRLAAARQEGAACGEQERLLAQQIEEKEKTLAALASDDDAFLRARSALSDALGESRMEKLALEKDLEAARDAIEALEGRSGESAQRVQALREAMGQLQAQAQQARARIGQLQGEKQQAAAGIAACEEAIRQATARRLAQEGSITRQTARMKELAAQKETLTREISRLDERRVALEAEYDATTAKLWEEYELTLNDAVALSVPFESAAQLRRSVAELRASIRALGNVNVGAIEEYAQLKQRYEFMCAQVADVEKSKRELAGLIGQLSDEMRRLFNESFARINENFGRIFAELFGGGSASLSLTGPEDVLESGIDISVAPPGKIIKNLSALSGGEQTLVAIAIYFAILAVNPAPFCVLDEIEAALDDVNVVRFAAYLQRIAGDIQFIVITHRRGTMEAADVLYGVTMQEDGVSRLLRLDLDAVDATLVS